MKYLTENEYEGTVRINNQDIRTIDSDSVYQKIGYIQRNEFLIDGSVKDNIVLYRENISSGELSQYNQLFVNCS